MTTLSHEPSHHFSLANFPVELWASFAISVMWLAVPITAVWGPSIVSNDGSTVPCAVVVAFFAFLGTWVVARYGLRQRP
jgi:hypothetical protein